MGAAQSSRSLALKPKHLNGRPRLRPIFCLVALVYIALIFATDFILDPLQARVIGKYPRTYTLTYLPFSLLLVGGAGLRINDFTQRRSR
jgi:hypothetical protein